MYFIYRGGHQKSCTVVTVLLALAQLSESGLRSFSRNASIEYRERFRQRKGP